MAAWTKTVHERQWRRVRPAIALREASVMPVRSRHRSSWHRQDNPLTPPAEIDGEFDEWMLADPKRRWFVQRSREEQRIVSEFFADIPPHVRSAVEVFQTRQWHLLAMAARCPMAVELLQSNPALAFALASCWLFTGSLPSRAMPLM